jgi:hypothetical protein
VDRELYNVVKISTGFDLPIPQQPKGNNMSTAIEEYKKSVKEEGVEENRNEIVTNMLHENMSISVIEKVTNMPHDQIIQIAKANNIPLP